MAITLVQFWQQERDTHEAAQTAAQNDLAMAQLALVTAKALLDADVAGLNKLAADIAANRAKLATTSVPSDVTALNNTIRDQIAQQRAMQGGVMDDQDAVAAAQSDANAANAALKRATSRLTDSEAALTAAKDANKQRQLLKSQLAAPPFDTMQADATTAAASTAATDAKAEIDANFPPALQTIAGKRYATRSTRATQLRQSVIDAEDALGATLAGASGLSGDAAQKGADFRHAEQALRDYATTAKQRYDRAISVLADLQAMKNGTKTPDLLTAQEKLDVASSAARTTAETNAEPVDTDRIAVYTARQDLDAQIITQIGTDVDKLATDPTVKAKRDAITATAVALKAAQDALVASGDRKVLDDWQVVVQDSAWRALIDYLDATAAITELRTTVPATLATTLDTAEDAYATALAAAKKAQRQADALADIIALRAERVDASSAALSGRLLSAVRGDSF
jgi:trimeric autotransporter adhesin